MTGLYGGAFDPPHVGHVALADGAKREFGITRLVVLVSARPGHKGTHCPPEVRLELARAAFPDGAASAWSSWRARARASAT